MPCRLTALYHGYVEARHGERIWARTWGKLRSATLHSVSPKFHRAREGSRGFLAAVDTSRKYYTRRKANEAQIIGAGD